MKKFSHRLNYSFGNEDWVTEQKALMLRPTDRVLCITASGDRPLHLLQHECAQVTAVDMNPHQNQLVKLKAAAMLHLNFEDYIGFLGGKECGRRHHLLLDLLPSMDTESRLYWTKHKKKIMKGILYQGAIEKWTKIISSFIKFFRKDKIEKLFAFDCIEKQKAFVKDEWATAKWKKTFEIVLNPFVTKFLLKDPGLHEHVDDSIKVGRYLHDKINSSLETTLAKESILISMVMTGKVFPEAYPPYLTKEGSVSIRPQLHKLSVVTEDIIRYIENAPDCSFDAFSLSDVASYLPLNKFERLIAGIARTAKPGARFCLRQFMSNRQIPLAMAPFFKRNPFLENELERQDKCFVYRFMAGTIDK